MLIEFNVVLFFSFCNVNSVIYRLQLLRARRRARYLGLVRPPTLAELRKTHRRKRREALIHKTLRCAFVNACAPLYI